MKNFTSTTHGNQNSFSNLFEYIRRYHDPSYPTFIPIAPKSKVPIKGVRWQNNPNITLDMFIPGVNIALKAGALFGDGYIFIVDFDSDDEKLFSEFLQSLEKFGIPTDTVIVRSGGKHHGFHLYYLSNEPIDMEKYKATVRHQFHGVNVEIVLHSHYVLIPPSIVEDQYKIIYPQNLIFVEPQHIRKINPEAILMLFDNNHFNSKELPVVTITLSQIKETSITFQLTLSNCYQKKVISGAKSLYKKDFVFWMYKRLYEEKYGKKFKGRVDTGMNLLSPIRRERHQSFQFIEEANGEILGYDFGKADEIAGQKALRIQELYYAFKTGEVKKLNPKELRDWTIRIILDYNVWTPESIEYYEKALNFLEEARSKIPKLFYRVFDYLLGRAVMMARMGENGSISARWIEKETGVPYPKANMALNILVACGLINKTRPETIVYTDKHGREREGITWVLAPVIDFDLNKAIKILNKLHEYLKPRGGFYRFSRNAVKAIGLDIGKIFKSGRDRYGGLKGDEKPKDDHSERQILFGSNSRRSEAIAERPGDSLFRSGRAQTSEDEQPGVREGAGATTERKEFQDVNQT